MLSSSELGPNKAGDLPSLSRERLLRASLHGLNRRPAPSVTRRLPDDPPCEVHSGLCGGDVRAGLEVGAHTNLIQRALCYCIILSLLPVGLRRVEEHALPELGHGVSARIALDALITGTAARPDLVPAYLCRPVLGNPWNDRVVEADLDVARARLQLELERPQHPSDLLDRSLGPAIARTVSDSGVLKDGANGSRLVSLPGDILLEFLPRAPDRSSR